MAKAPPPGAEGSARADPTTSSRMTFASRSWAPFPQDLRQDIPGLGSGLHRGFWKGVRIGFTEDVMRFQQDFGAVIGRVFGDL